MKLYHYGVLTKSEASHQESERADIDMENVDYKRQPEPEKISAEIAANGGLCSGVFRGGMFGLATNQVAVLSAWDETSFDSAWIERLASKQKWIVSVTEELLPTVRPATGEICERAGIYVIRWIRVRTSDIDEYTQLCLETWPAFEALTRSRCYGVFRPVAESETSKLLMLTWYQTLTDWEQSRRLNPADAAKWARRSEMELSHWAEAGRLAIIS